MAPATALRLVRLIHTGFWALFAGAILALFPAAWLGRFDWVAGLAALVLLEVLVLAANGMRCPLTAVAARYTSRREDNFDIYLPLWLARYNKRIFGSLYLLGLACAAVLWLLRPA